MYDEMQEEQSQGDLAQLSRLAEELRQAELEVLAAEEHLERRKAHMRSLAEHDIPLLMAECGMELFRTYSGLKIEISKVYGASIPEGLREQAFDWLESHGHGGMIKHNITVVFPRDQQAAAEKLAKEMTEKFENVKDESKVESSTLRAWVKRQIESAVPEFPRTLFGASEIHRAKVSTK